MRSAPAAVRSGARIVPAHRSSDGSRSGPAGAAPQGASVSNSPCGSPARSRDSSTPARSMCASRATLATIDAALTQATLASPSTTGSIVQRSPRPARIGQRSPSTITCSGAHGNASSALRIARKVACRMLSASISAASAQPIPHARLRRRISPASSSRRAAVSTFESARPSIVSRGSSMTAAAVTGPASGPRPASSTPTTQRGLGHSKLPCRPLALHRRAVPGPAPGWRRPRTRWHCGAAASVYRLESPPLAPHVRPVELLEHRRAQHLGVTSSWKNSGTRSRPASRFGCEKTSAS